jgi:hypothetical protein
LQISNYLWDWIFQSSSRYGQVTAESELRRLKSSRNRYGSRNCKYKAMLSSEDNCRQEKVMKNQTP